MEMEPKGLIACDCQVWNKVGLFCDDIIVNSVVK